CRVAIALLATVLAAVIVPRIAATPLPPGPSHRKPLPVLTPSSPPPHRDDRPILYCAQAYRWSGHFYREERSRPEETLAAVAAAPRGPINPDGSGRTRLTFGLLDCGSPAWSPDGQHIVFAGCLMGPHHPDDPIGTRHLYVINADGSGRRRLTFGTADDALP